MFEGEATLSQWQDVGINGEADLNLSMLSYFAIGTHVLILEVSNGLQTVSDEMILAIENSAPHAGPAGGGIYEIGSAVILGGQDSDFDGDVLTYEWLEGQEVLFSGLVQTVNGGDPVNLPEHLSDNLGIGNHILLRGVMRLFTLFLVNRGFDCTCTVLQELPNSRLPNRIFTITRED